MGPGPLHAVILAVGNLKKESLGPNLAEGLVRGLGLRASGLYPWAEGSTLIAIEVFLVAVKELISSYENKENPLSSYYMPNCGNLNSEPFMPMLRQFNSYCNSVFGA